MPSLEILLAAALLTATPATRPIQFPAADGITVHADHYTTGDPTAPLVLLFHQARSNRGEYRAIAPHLVELGFQALAIDQRSGGGRWGLENQTVHSNGHSTGYLEALPDLEAALVWARSQSGSKGPILVWGSSYSAALVFLLAAEHPRDIAGVLSFSPGEYLGKPDLVVKNAAKVRLPVLILAPESERAQAATILHAVRHQDKSLEVPKQAVHGASMLMPALNPGAADVWPPIEAFLKRLTAGSD